MIEDTRHRGELEHADAGIESPPDLPGDWNESNENSELRQPETPYDRGETDHLLLPEDDEDGAPLARYVHIRGFDKQKQWEQERQLLAAHVAEALGDDWAVQEQGNYGLKITKGGHDATILPPDFEATMDAAMLGWKIERIEQLLAEHAESFDGLAAELAPFIMAGKVHAIVSDDVVGRIPSEYVSLLANRWAGEHGLPQPPLLSVAGGTLKGETVDAGGALNEDAITHGAGARDWVAKKNHALDMRVAQPDFDGLQDVLIVSEFTLHGDSLERICRAFGRRGIHADIAILESSGPRERFSRSMADLQPKVFVGKEQSRQEALYNMIVRQATGIRRMPGEAFAVPNPNAHPDLVAATRKQLQSMADKAYEKYFSQA